MLWSHAGCACQNVVQICCSYSAWCFQQFLSENLFTWCHKLHKQTNNGERGKKMARPLSLPFWNFGTQRCTVLLETACHPCTAHRWSRISFAECPDLNRKRISTLCPLRVEGMLATDCKVTIHRSFSAVPFSRLDCTYLEQSKVVPTARHKDLPLKSTWLAGQQNPNNRSRNTAWHAFHLGAAWYTGETNDLGPQVENKLVEN